MTRRAKSNEKVFRFACLSDPFVVLGLVAGDCFNEGEEDAAAGWCYYLGGLKPQTVSGRLEKRGPFDEPGIQSKERAELRAVIGVLRHFDWEMEQVKCLVIATDSEYVVSGGTALIAVWLHLGWVHAEGEPVENRDLWESLLGEVQHLHEHGVETALWHVDKGDNIVANWTAQLATGIKRVPEFWVDY